MGFNPFQTLKNDITTGVNDVKKTLAPPPSPPPPKIITPPPIPPPKSPAIKTQITTPPPASKPTTSVFGSLTSFANDISNAGKTALTDIGGAATVAAGATKTALTDVGNAEISTATVAATTIQAAPTTLTKNAAAVIKNPLGSAMGAYNTVSGGINTGLNYGAAGISDIATAGGVAGVEAGRLAQGKQLESINQATNQYFNSSIKTPFGSLTGKQFSQDVGYYGIRAAVGVGTAVLAPELLPEFLGVTTGGILTGGAIYAGANLGLGEAVSKISTGKFYTPSVKGVVNSFLVGEAFGIAYSPISAGITRGAQALGLGAKAALGAQAAGAGGVNVGMAAAGGQRNPLQLAIAFGTGAAFVAGGHALMNSPLKLGESYSFQRTPENYANVSASDANARLKVSTGDYKVGKAVFNRATGEPVYKASIKTLSDGTKTYIDETGAIRTSGTVIRGVKVVDASTGKAVGSVRSSDFITRPAIIDNTTGEIKTQGKFGIGGKVVNATAKSTFDVRTGQIIRTTNITPTDETYVKASGSKVIDATSGKTLADFKNAGVSGRAGLRIVSGSRALDIFHVGRVEGQLRIGRGTMAEPESYVLPTGVENTSLAASTPEFLKSVADVKSLGKSFGVLGEETNAGYTQSMFRMGSDVRGLRLNTPTESQVQSAFSENQTGKAVYDALNSGDMKKFDINFRGSNAARIQANGLRIGNDYDFDANNARSAKTATDLFARKLNKSFGTTDRFVANGTHVTDTQTGDKVLEIHYQGEPQVGVNASSVSEASTVMGYKIGEPIKYGQYRMMRISDITGTKIRESLSERSWNVNGKASVSKFDEEVSALKKSDTETYNDPQVQKALAVTRTNVLLAEAKGIRYTEANPAIGRFKDIRDSFDQSNRQNQLRTNRRFSLTKSQTKVQADINKAAKFANQKGLISDEELTKVQNGELINPAKTQADEILKSITGKTRGAPSGAASRAPPISPSSSMFNSFIRPQPSSTPSTSSNRGSIGGSLFNIGGSQSGGSRPSSKTSVPSVGSTSSSGSTSGGPISPSPTPSGSSTSTTSTSGGSIPTSSKSPPSPQSQYLSSVVSSIIKGPSGPSRPSIGKQGSRSGSVRSPSRRPSPSRTSGYPSIISLTSLPTSLSPSRPSISQYSSIYPSSIGSGSRSKSKPSPKSPPYSPPYFLSSPGGGGQGVRGGKGYLSGLVKHSVSLNIAGDIGAALGLGSSQTVYKQAGLNPKTMTNLFKIAKPKRSKK